MRNFYKSIASIFLLLAFTSTSKAQSILGLHSDNYAGVYALGYNPAEIVDSRYKFHFNLASFNTTISSNYLGLKREAFFGEDQSLFDPAEMIKNIAKRVNYYKVQRKDIKNRNIYSEGEISILPSFMMNFGKDNNQAIGFSYKLRYQSALLGEFADFGIMSLVNSSILTRDKSSTESNTIQFNVWNEYGLTYGRTLLDTGNNFISAALTLKVTQGYAGAYISSKKSFSYDQANTGGNIGLGSNITLDNEIYFAQSKVLSAGGTGLGGISPSTLFKGNVGFGFDIGGVWEYRPNIEKYRYELDGFSDYLDPRKEKYRLKIGLALLDIGYVNYSSNEGDNASYAALVNASNVRNVVEPISQGLNDNLKFSGVATALNSISANKKVDDSNKTSFIMMLPSKLNAYADYRVSDNFYANASASLSPDCSSCDMKGLSEFAITPRFEKKWFSAYVPFSANLNGNASIGAGFRAGPLVFGMRDVLPFLGKKQIYEANIYVGISVPIFKSVNDGDEDHVSDYYDACKDKKGPWENQGCPYDADEDGVPDESDLCPETSGSEEMQGCPDTDNDGLHDGIDRCIDKEGSEETQGCPDTDDDGVVDIDDMCPEAVGTEEYKGCPDTDEDKVHDGIDDCIEVPGEKKYNGCVDTDKDTLRDIDDKCPNTFGKLIYEGCPPSPPVILENYRQFDSNMIALPTSSKNHLDTIIKFMNDNPEYDLLIEGHTDATAAIPYNQIVIGEQRALNVKKYFIKKGLSSSRIKTKSLGEKVPVVDNSTPEGRKRNRRVEFKFTSSVWEDNK